ncbi:MAG: cryptochrome/photolyase family protein [Ilumatobacteraceae bacterium]
MTNRTSVVWFRRDLRTIDHPALCRAVADGAVLPLFVIDPAFSASSRVRRAALAGMLASLDRDLGGALHVAVGDPIEIVPAVAAAIGAEVVHVSRDHGPYGHRRDAAVAERLRADGRRLIGTGSNHLVDPTTVTKADGSPYAVFTPFSRTWRSVLAESGNTVLLDAPSNGDWITGIAGAVDDPRSALGVSADESTLIDDVHLDLSTASALQRWSTFRDEGLDHYEEKRNLPAEAGTSSMSSALRFGLVHPARLLADLDPGSEDHRTFESELCWRDFYADVLFRRPETAWENLDRRLDGIALDTADRARERFALWCEGRTGFEIVDAGMRQLLATGWMHNRVRMIVASFLVKDLHLPWQWGARFFMEHLIDGDLASNNHGWQWAAGTGTDAAPYFRVFNPVTQAERWDPDRSYRARWVPELDSTDYPAPMVDHARERDEALVRYKAARGG